MTRSLYKFLVIALICSVFAGITPAAYAEYDTGGVIKNIMSNGLTLLIRPEPDANVVAIEVFIRGGAADEDKSIDGIGHLLAGSILSGTEGRAPLKLARLVSEVGGNFHAVWQWNYTEIYAITVPSMWSDTLGLLADSIQESTLDQRAVEYARSSILRQISHENDDPFNLAYTTIRQMIHRNTPYDRSYLGDTSAIKSISQQKLMDFYSRNVTADKIVISVAGNVDPDAVQRRVEGRFRNMTRGRSTAAGVKMSQPSHVSSGDVTINTAAPVTYIMLGYPAAGVDDPDYPAMCVADILLGGNKSSLLFTKLREGLGLGYQVGSLYPVLKGGSHMVAYLNIDSQRATPDVIKTVRENMIQQFDVLKSGSFSDDDLERAKRYLIGNHALKHERTRDRAFYLGWHEAMGLGYQYDFQLGDNIRKVTREDIKRACGKYLNNPAFVVLDGAKKPE